MNVLSGKRELSTALASKSTLCRLESTPGSGAQQQRYKKVRYDPAAIDRLLVELFVESKPTAPRQIVIDLDVTDTPLHGHQQGRFFHGFYDHYCYLPLYLFCGDQLLGVRLREANQDASAGSLEEIRRIVAQIREHWSEVHIVLRADSGFCREELMRWCEDNGVEYVFGLARNDRLRRRIDKALRKAATASQRSGKAARTYTEFRYRTLKSWSRQRRVVAKAEQIEGKQNPRYLATSLKGAEWRPRELYEQLDCPRGEMENRIKLIVIVEVFVAQRQPIDALRQHLLDAMLDALGRTKVGETLSQARQQVDPPIHLPQKQRSAVAGQPATVEIGHDRA